MWIKSLYRVVVCESINEFSPFVSWDSHNAKKKTTTTNSEEIQTPLNDATDLAEKHFKNAQLGFWKSRKIVNDALIKMMMDCLQAVRLVYVK